MVSESDGAQGRDGLLGSLSRSSGAQHLLQKDPTGRLLGTIALFESVETWTLTGSGYDTKTEERIKISLQDLARVLEDYSRRIPADNLQVVHLLTSLQLRTMLQVVDYLSRVQSDFFLQFVTYCKEISSDDLLAFAAVRRFEALMVSGWADRAFNDENAQFIIDVLGREEMNS